MEWEPNTFCRSRKYNQRSCARNGNRTQSADHVHSAGTGHHLQILYIQREPDTISRSCTFNGHRTQSAHHVHSTVTGHNLQIRCTQQEPDTIRRSRYAIGTNRTMRILRTLLTTLCPSRASDPLHALYEVKIGINCMEKCNSCVISPMQKPMVMSSPLTVTMLP